MDTVRQCLLQLLAKTNIVPAEGAPGLEREREKKKREKISPQSPPLFFTSRDVSGVSSIRYIVYGSKDATNHSAVYRTARFLTVSSPSIPNQAASTQGDTDPVVPCCAVWMMEYIVVPKWLQICSQWHWMDHFGVGILTLNNKMKLSTLHYNLWLVTG